MRERAGFERELRELFPAEEPEREYELRGDWQAEQAFQKAELSTPEQDERGAITVTAFRFPGTTNQVALVFAGVHGSEPQGVTAAEEVLNKLKDASTRGVKPKFTTIVIPRLIQTSRFSKRGTAIERLVLVGSRKIEPNRNFPAPGESYDYARERGQRRADKAELLDCKGTKASDDKVTHRMLAETRILTQLIEREKPVRAWSIHSHSIPGVAGDGPGIFVDPRGGFNEHTGAAFTTDGKFDDTLALDLFTFARTAVIQGLGLPLRDNAGRKDLSDPFKGNLLATLGRFLPIPTVHYATTKHPCGTSFGMWAPEPERSGLRKGITTITSELPQYERVAQSNAAAEMVRVHVETLLRRFIELP